MIRYRIGIINDFDNSHSYITYTDYGTMQVWGGSRTATAHRGYQLATDTIGVFLNFALLGEYIDKERARAHVNELLRSAPSDLGDLAHYLTIP